MKYVKLMLFIVAMIGTLLFSGCGNKETETTPVISDEAEEVESTETEEIEPVEEVEPEMEEILEEDNSDASINNDSDKTNIGGNNVDDEVLKEEGYLDSQNIPSDNYTNGGKGFDHKGVHYDTWGEYMEVFDKEMKADGNYLTPEQAHAKNEALKRGAYYDEEGNIIGYGHSWEELKEYLKNNNPDAYEHCSSYDELMEYINNKNQ